MIFIFFFDYIFQNSIILIMNVISHKVFTLTQLLHTQVLKNIDSSILTTSILLNNPYFKYNDKIQQLIVNSNNVIVADGAANYLIYKKLNNIIDKVNYIVGDFDSIESKTIEEFSKLNKTVQYMRSSCQDTTDLQKCYALIRDIDSQDNQDTKKQNFIFVFGATGGRADHSFANIHAGIYEYNNEKMKKYDIVNISSSVINYILVNEGQYEITIDNESIEGAITVFNDVVSNTNSIEINFDNVNYENLPLLEKRLYLKEFAFSSEKESKLKILKNTKSKGVILSIKY